MVESRSFPLLTAFTILFNLIVCSILYYVWQRWVWSIKPTIKEKEDRDREEKDREEKDREEKKEKEERGENEENEEREEKEKKEDRDREEKDREEKVDEEEEKVLSNLPPFASKSAPLITAGENLCNCCTKGPICLHACYCLWWRSIDTYITAGLIDRKEALVYFLALSLGGICFNCAYRPCLRAKLRHRFYGEPDPTVRLHDVLITWFCLPCATCQEAREVDKAVNVQTTMCCYLEPYAIKEENEVPSIGDAVHVEISGVERLAAGVSTSNQ